jgi:nitrite reductase/ring-hydroxylating ferredoxin subunit
MAEPTTPWPVGRLEDIPDGQARGFVRGSGSARLAVLVARRGARIFAYRNECPHAFVPLDWSADKFMSWDGTNLQCATHGAQFRVEDGLCVLGPCRGQRLRPIAARIDADGQLVLDVPGA